jgi:pyridoxamine 5'-phosphate oxidase
VADKPNVPVRPLHEADLHPDPIEQFRMWYGRALELPTPQPTAMTLATASAAGRPSARVVLLKQFDESGFVFFTNYESRKGCDVRENPWAALVFYWPELEQQVRIEGKVEPISAKASDAYFNTRTVGSRLSAAASPQSQVIASRDTLDLRVAEIERAYPDGNVPRPANWGGLRLVPEVIEFWQARENRLHDRLRYRLEAPGKWRIERLAP